MERVGDGAKDSGRARKSELNDFSGALGVGDLKKGVRITFK